jgi:hypothetical protein
LPPGAVLPLGTTLPQGLNFAPGAITPAPPGNALPGTVLYPPPAAPAAPATPAAAGPTPKAAFSTAPSVGRPFAPITATPGLTAGIDLATAPAGFGTPRAHRAAAPAPLPMMANRPVPGHWRPPEVAGMRTPACPSYSLASASRAVRRPQRRPRPGRRTPPGTLRHNQPSQDGSCRQTASGTATPAIPKRRTRGQTSWRRTRDEGHCSLSCPGLTRDPAKLKGCNSATPDDRLVRWLFGCPFASTGVRIPVGAA